CCPADQPARNKKKLTPWAKANRDKSNSVTRPQAFTIARQLPKRKSGIPAVAIPYKSSNESNLSVVSGQSLFTISDGPPVIPLVKAGKIRALAVTGSERSSELPDVPSMAEAGFPDVDTQPWSGFFLPVGTPGPIVDKLTTELAKALAAPAVQEGLQKMAVKPGGPTGSDFKKRIEADIKSFAEVVKAANLSFK